MGRGEQEPCTENEKRFCEIYTADLRISGAQAAREAGYSIKSAGSIASELLTYPRVLNEIARLNKARFEKSDYHAMDVIRELIKIGHSSIEDIYEEVEIETGEEDFLGEPVVATVRRLRSLEKLRNVAAISSVKQGAHGIEVKFWDKNRALDTLAKHFKLMNDTLEVTVKETDDLSKLSTEELMALKQLKEKMNK